MSENRTFWQIVADAGHPMWKAVWGLLIVGVIYFTPNNFDLTGTDGRNLLHLLVAIGGFEGLRSTLGALKQ